MIRIRFYEAFSVVNKLFFDCKNRFVQACAFLARSCVGNCLQTVFKLLFARGGGFKFAG